MHVLGLLIYAILKVFITSDCNLMPEFLYTKVAFFLPTSLLPTTTTTSLPQNIYRQDAQLLLLLLLGFFWPESESSETEKRKLVATLLSAIHKLVCGQCTTQRCAVKNGEGRKRKATLSGISGSARLADALFNEAPWRKFVFSCHC